jgi:glycosyltransferase involved in cell wall biosynthesis
MMEHFRVAKEYGMDIDVLVPANCDALRLDYITRNNLAPRKYSDDAELLDMLGEYDVISAYEFGGPIQRQMMERYDNFVPEVAWNRPTYGTYWGFPGGENYGLCLALAKRKVKAFIARSRSVYDCLVQEGMPEERIHLVWGCCDTERFKPRPKPAHLQDKLVFLFIGRLQEQKGIFELFHSFCRANIPGSVLICIGPPHPTNPWDLEQVRKWADMLGFSERVNLHTEVPETEVHKYFNWGDVFVTFPNTDVKFVEQVGLTVPQAMASGLAVITYDYGGQAGFIDPSCGITIPHKDYVAGAAAMWQLADPALRELMSTSARTIATRFYDVHNYAKGIKKAYERAM